MALSGAASQLRCAVLQHLRIPVSSAGMLPSLRLWDLPSQFRGFAGGSYLDKDEVTQRVLNVAKHFEKVDPAKVLLSSSVCVSSPTADCERVLAT